MWARQLKTTHSSHDSFDMTHNSSCHENESWVCRESCYYRVWVMLSSCVSHVVSDIIEQFCVGHCCCRHICIHMYILSVYIHICVYVHIHVYIHTHIYIYICSYLASRLVGSFAFDAAAADTSVYIYINIRTYKHLYTHTYIYIYIYHTYTHIYTHTHIYIYIHTYLASRLVSSFAFAAAAADTSACRAASSRSSSLFCV